MRLPSIFLLFIFNIGIAQELPEIVPPSPQAFEMTKYGDVPINESSGMVNASIPIYNYKVGSIQLPISLSYSAHGVKVNALSSWTGINWVLNAGGVITRTVKDELDEKHSTATRKLYSRTELDAMNFDPYNTSDIAFLNDLAIGNRDTQADLFSFNFAGYSGSFFLDKDFKAKLTNYETELDIEFLGGVQAHPNNTSQTIIITDPSGTKYYFGGAGAIEGTNGLGGIEQSNFNNGGASTTDTYNTAYYLYKIENTLGDIVYLEYDNIGQYFIYWGQNQSETKRLLLYSGCGESVQTPTWVSSSNTASTQHVFNGRYLSRIYNNRNTEEVHFNSISPSIPNINFARELQDIEVYDNNVTHKKIALDYLYDTNNNVISRFFLKKISFYDTNNSNSYDYELEYNAPTDLPARNSYSQDFLGYYNGKSNNTLLPQGSNYFKGYGYSDRSSDFQYASKGCLTKITYPTGGNTEFEYEAPLLYKFPEIGKHMQAYVNQDNYLPETDFTDFVYLSYPNPFPPGEGDGNPIHEITQDQSINIVINVDAEHLFTLKDCDIKVTLYNFLNGNPGIIDSQTFNLFTTQDPIINPITSHSFNKNFSLTANTGYKVGIEIIPDRTDPNFVVPSHIKIKANAGFSIIGNEEIPVEAIGIRIKKVVDTPIQGIPIVKHYIYKEIDKLNENSDSMDTPPSINAEGYVKIYQDETCCGISATNLSSMAQLSNNPLEALLNNDFLFYRRVTISYGDKNFKNGGVEKTFHKTTAVPLSPYGAFNTSGFFQKEYVLIHDNSNLFNGKLLRKIQINKKNNAAYISNETVYDYTLDNSNFITNWVISKTYRCNENTWVYGQDPRALSFYDFINMGWYKTFSSKFQLTSKTTREFYEDIPIEDKSLLDIETDSYISNNTIETYEYDSYVNQPTKITVSTSDSNKVLETKNYYVDMVEQLSGLTPTQISACNTLKDNNNITSSIQTETYQKEGANSPELLSTQRTLYKNWNGGNLVLPEFIQTSKGNTLLQNRIQFHHYFTNNGNIREVSKDSGALIAYIWGYDERYPIAKIENAYFSDIPLSLYASIESKSNLDDDSCLDSDTCNEKNLRAELNKLRDSNIAPNLSNAQITTYTFDPLKGVTSITDPKGYTTYYEYDAFNRLKLVRDHQGKIISDNKYHYKGQQ